MKNHGGALGATALIALLLGVGGSMVFMFRVGRNSRFLELLFGVWVLSPFVALVFTHMVSKHWPLVIRGTLYVMMVIIAVGSVVIYGDVAIGPPRPQPAFAFLIVPLVSWLGIAIVVPIAASRSRRNLKH
jgi:hypothetical protein